MQNRSSAIAQNIEKLKQQIPNEPINSFFQFQVVEISEGFSRVTMVVRPEYVNFNGIIFGGVIMALADQAFAYASNTVIYPNIASQFNIHLLNGSTVGDALTAQCTVIKRGKRACVSEIEVISQNGTIIAKATGTTIPKID